MRDYMTIGSVPANEDCAQLGSPGYYEAMRVETTAFINQIIRHYPPVAGARVGRKAFEHDFGTYHEVVVSFDPDVEAQVRYAYEVEADDKGVLGEWDDEAREELARVGYAAMARASVSDYGVNK